MSFGAWGELYNPHCEVCGAHVDNCICPECPICQTNGDPKCYEEHGLEKSDEQIQSAIQHSPDTTFPDDVF